MSPSPHINPALAREREAEIRRRDRRPRPPASPRAIGSEAAAGASLLIGIAGLIALGAPI
jgi:hypothetical protein